MKIKCYFNIKMYDCTYTIIIFLTSFQMKVCMDEFKSLAARYAELHQSSFDADYATLRNVELYPLAPILVLVLLPILSLVIYKK